MTIETMIHDLESYYGDSYGEAGKRVMIGYLKGLDDGLLPYLYREVLRTYERRYKTAPGVAECERIKKEARAEMRSALALAAATEPRLQIEEDTLDPGAVQDILGKLAASKSVDS